MSQDGTIAFAQVDTRGSREFEELLTVGEDIVDYGDEAITARGLAVEYGGDLFSEFELPERARSTA